MASISTRLAQIRDETTSSADILKVYDEWAENYDQTLDDSGARTNARSDFLLKLLSKLLKGRKDVSILDCAAGTGFYGAVLSNDGYTHIDAVDGSEKMLEKARERKVYKRIVCEFVGAEKMDFPDETYDLIFCLGALYENHIKDDCFSELLRISKPGAFIIFGVLEHAASKKFENTMQEYHDTKKWIRIERKLVDDYAFRVKSDGFVEKITGLAYVFQKPA